MITHTGPELQRMWDALGEDPAALGRVAAGGYPALVARLPVSALVRDSVATASLAAALLIEGDGPRPSGTPLVSLDADRILTAVTSERHFRLNGTATRAWAEFSGFWRCSGGWVRTHTNYPHHEARLLRLLGLPADTDADAFAAKLADLDPFELEERAAEAGAIAYAVRSPEEWARHPQAQAVRERPLVVRERLGEAAPAGRPTAADASAPLRGIRVLDLTRVIAGPVSTRTLALLGADVLRVDTPAVPELGRQHLDTGPGKTSALLDLGNASDARTFEQLLQTADVVVTGYRPGALSRFGLAPADLADRRPGIIVGQVSAWGDTGPWAGRRGFDSIVQAVSGIARIESPDGDRPGALPAQALDHTAGYLLAAGILSALRRQRADGGSSLVAVALARVAQELLTMPRESAAEPDGAAPAVGEPTTVTMPAPGGEVTCALPALTYAGGPASWPAPPRPWGSDRPEWQPRGDRRRSERAGR